MDNQKSLEIFNAIKTLSTLEYKDFETLMKSTARANYGDCTCPNGGAQSLSRPV